MREEKGPFLSQISKKLPKKAPGVTDPQSTYGGHDIKDTEKERTKVHTAETDLLDAIVGQLETLFPDGPIMSAFASLITPQEDESHIQVNHKKIRKLMRSSASS